VDFAGEESDLSGDPAAVAEFQRARLTERVQGSNVMNGTGVFVLTEAKALVAMQTAAFASEDDFQDLLARFPALLAGDQIDSANPRRFMLIDREQPIACEIGGAGRWSLDHLFLDQDGIPTLVEVKRGTDTRIRREVVGQMMDYAAKAVRYWPAQGLRDCFSARCEKEGKTAIEAFGQHFGADQDLEAFWAKVAANLAMGRIRMLFVADRIPAEYECPDAAGRGPRH
jgi:hypothetical protein